MFSVCDSHLYCTSEAYLFVAYLMSFWILHFSFTHGFVCIHVCMYMCIYRCIVDCIPSPLTSITEIIKLTLPTFLFVAPNYVAYLSFALHLPFAFRSWHDLHHYLHLFFTHTHTSRTRLPSPQFGWLLGVPLECAFNDWPPVRIRNTIAAFKTALITCSFLVWIVIAVVCM